MALDPSSHAAVAGGEVSEAGISQVGTTASAAQRDQKGQVGDETPDWDLLPSSQQSQLYIDYKRLAIEVATRIAPDLQETLETTVQAALFKLQSEVQSHAGRLSELEQRVSALEDDNATLGATVNTLAHDNTLIRDKLEDLENRSRRNNLRMVGLSEDIPQRDLQHICEVDLPKSLGLSHACRVERVHRLGPDRSLRSPPGDKNKKPPRQTIMKFLDYNDKVDILRAFRKHGSPLEIGGSRLLLFEDFSAEVAKKRRSFSHVCSRLYACKIRFRLLYPATLIINSPEGPPRSFTAVEEAEKAAEELCKLSPRISQASSKGKRHRDRAEQDLDNPPDRLTVIEPKDRRPQKHTDKDRRP